MKITFPADLWEQLIEECKGTNTSPFSFVLTATRTALNNNNKEFINDSTKQGNTTTDY